MARVKIASGWSNPGGSTLHHIGLTKLLNEAGHECTFYGPHTWHMSKCSAENIHNLTIEPDDILISHFLDPATFVGAPCRKHILSCHETDLYPLKQIKDLPFDLIQYVSNRQRAWHGVNHPFVIIPPRVETVEWSAPGTKTAGVIGSIDAHKQTAEAIALALEKGYERIMLYGDITDTAYYQTYVQPFVYEGTALVMGHKENRKAMYATLDAVFHMSKRETYGMVEAECKSAGIPFYGNENHPIVISDEEVLEKWESLLI